MPADSERACRGVAGNEPVRRRCGLLARIAALAALLGAAVLAPGVLAQDGPPAPPVSEPEAPSPASDTVDRPPLTSDEIRGLITETESGEAGLEAAAREALLSDLRAALEATQRREAVLGEAQAFAQEASEAPQRIEQLRQELSQPPAAVQVSAPEGATLEEVRQRVQEAAADLEAARAEFQRLQGEAARRTARLDEIPRLVAELRTRLEDLRPPADAPALAAATLQQKGVIAKRRAERTLVEAQIQRLESELSSYRARQDLLPLRRDRAQRRVETATRTLEQWQAIESQRSQAEASARQQEAQRLQREAALLSPTLSEIAETNEALASLRTGESGIVRELAGARDRLRSAQGELDRLRSRVLSTLAKVEATGLSDAVGVLLRNELKNLPEIDDLSEERKRLQDELGDAQYQLIIIEERLSDVRDVEAALPELVERVRASNPEVDPALVETVGRELLAAQGELLRSLRSEFSSFIEVGADLDAALASSLRLAREYRSFIEERVLWTRSVPGRRLPQLGSVVEAAAWLASPSGWADVLRTAWGNVVGVRGGLVLTVLLLIGSVVASVRSRRKLADLASKVRKFSTDRFAYSLEAVPLTVLIAAPIPLAAVALSQLLRGGEHSLTAALSSGLMMLGVALTVIEFVRHAIRPGGLADAHFRWAREGLADFRRWVTLLEIVVTPVLLVVVMMSAQPNESWNDSLGRVAFIVSMVLLSAFYGIALAPWRVFARPHLEKHPSGVLARTRWLWYPGMVGLPLALALLALAGFYYTASELNTRVRLTMWMLAAITLVYCLGLRWLLVERRRLLVQRAKQRREAAAAAAASGTGGTAETALPAEASEALDVPDIDAQTRRIVSAAVVTALLLGMYAMWADVLPALRMMQRVQVWPTAGLLEQDLGSLDPLREAAGESAALGGGGSANGAASGAANGAGANGGAAGSGGSGDGGGGGGAPLPIPGMPSGGGSGSGSGGGAGGADGGSESIAAIGVITLNDIAVSLLVLVFTVVLSRNLPGLLEITILKRLPLDGGARFAISAVLRYLLVIVGVLLAFAAIGVSWSKVQWLVAALTFGLAFGLQEIFANFISGLIMFAERPVRVGDTVTVTGISGTVTQIRMRATTVRDWDYKELVIPNKVFITDQVVNWTLSDQRIRIIMPVGVSYDSDVRQVYQTLLDIAAGHENVVEDPKPVVMFAGFGDSTLNFELRCFLPSLDAFLSTRTELYMRITERFRELGIEIAYPQRDLHIRSADPIAQILADQRSRGGRSLPGGEEAAD
ncbi:MAG: mechanosensitive ion channel domain-containing protein [Phycisphaerales bacterium]